MSYGQDLLWLARWSKPDPEPVKKPKYQVLSKISQTSKEMSQDDQKLELLLQSDFIDDGPEDWSRIGPNTLPLTKVPVPEHKPAIAPDGQVIKQEPLDRPDLGGFPQCATPQIPSLADLCTNPNMPKTGELLFFQLPDSLPGVQVATEPAQNESPNSSMEMEKQHIQNVQTKLQHFPEGYSGKLQVLRSGRMQLVLGSVTLIVDMGTNVTFHQELMSLRMAEGAANVSILGQVMHKLICLPDMEQLLQTVDT